MAVFFLVHIKTITTFAMVQELPGTIRYSFEYVACIFWYINGK